MLATPYNKASEAALAIYGSVLEKVRADNLVRVALQRVGDSLFVQGLHIDLSHFDRIWIAGSGKASVPMGQAVSEVLGDRLTGGVVVTKTGHGEPIPNVEVLEAAHPVPDESSLDAGRRMLEFASSMNEKDLVLFLLSGGSSSLLEVPVDGIALRDLQATNSVLLRSGADIGAMNQVRSRLSRIKAGGLARAFQPATVVVLVLSDVIGNDLQTIGSGPFIASKQVALTPYTCAFWELLPEGVRSVLDQPTFPRPIAHLVEHCVIGSVSLAIHAASDAANELGLEPLLFADPLRGEARIMAKKICKHASSRDRQNYCMIFGGETTVTIRGEGLGGRCQEMALAAAEPISKLRDVCFLAGSTDGTDGPTNAAGGFVDPDSLQRAKAQGVSARSSLLTNSSNAFLKACDGLILTGPTSSNVNDIVLVVHVGG